MTDRREPLVLVLGIQEEWAAVEVGKELDARGIRWIPLNVADFPLMMTLGAELTPDADGWHGSVRGAEHELPLEEVTAVYYGRPTEFVMPPGLSGPELRFSRAQARVGIGGVLASLKPLAESVVYEAGGEALVYTRRVQASELESLDGVESTAHLFQQWQPKLFEARVTVVGDRLFPVAIHASSEKAQVDWRADYGALRYEVINVPDQVRAGIARYLEVAGLAFSTFDFVIRPDGDWVALEANAIGAWGWLAEECGLPIAAAIADALTKE